MKTVVLMSGGLDSSVLAWKLALEGHEIIPVGFDYGQKHIRELHAHEKFVEATQRKFPHNVLGSFRIRLPKFGGSSQTSSTIDVPEGSYDAENMKLTVVPNRNMIMIATAVGLAIEQEAQAVAIAAHAGDHAIYPDCRVGFFDTLSYAIEQATEWTPVQLLRPFVNNTKADIAKLGDVICAPMHLTWSCYKGEEKHCGRCGTCVERAEAFYLAGVVDRTEYEDASYWREVRNVAKKGTK